MSILANSPVGSSETGCPSLIHPRIFSASLFLSLGDLCETGMEERVLNVGTEPSPEICTPLFLQKSKTDSISRALSSGDCPFFTGSLLAILANSPVGSSETGCPCLIHARTFPISFCLSSGDLCENGIEEIVLNAGTEPSSRSFTPVFLQ